jgi:predicted phage terminase large subunit-like protein
MDPASRTGSANDYSALPVLSIDLTTGQMFVRRGSMYRKASEDEIVAQCYTIDGLYPQITQYFEGNGFQRLFKYIFTLQFQIKQYGPKIETIDRTGDKILRMTGLLPYFNSGMVLFLQGDPDQERGIDDLVKVTYQKKQSAHDDWPDALIGAIDQVQTLLRNVGIAATSTESDNLDRLLKTPREVLRHSQHAQGWLSQRSTQEILITQIIQRPLTPQIAIESSLAQRVRVYIERQQAIPCSRREYLEIRQYLFQWRDRNHQLQATEAEQWIDAEIQRLDRQFQPVLH